MAVAGLLAPLRSMTRFSSRAPVECLVLGFTIVTLAYFQLLHAVKHSEFLHHPSAGAIADLHAGGPSDTAAFAAHDDELVTLRRSPVGRWEDVTSSSALLSEQDAIYLSRVVVTLDGTAPADDGIYETTSFIKSARPSTYADAGVASDDVASPAASLLDHEVQESLKDFQAQLAGASQIQDYCYRSSPGAACFTTAFDTSADPTKQARSALLAFGLHPASAEAAEHAHALLASLPTTDVRDFSYIPLASLHRKRSDGLGLSFNPLPSSYTRGLMANEDSRDLGSIKWTLYAGRAFASRFWGLAKQADSADIFVMLIGYILMHLTFISLFLNMRKLGSKFWLGCSVLVYGAFGFLISLLTAYLVGISINPIILSEALPFLVITVGFEKPFILARAIFTNPALTPVTANAPLLRSRRSQAHLYPSTTTNARVLAFGPANSLGLEQEDDATSLKSAGGGIRWGTPVPARDIVNQGFDRVGKQIIRDYAIEIAVLVAGSFTGVPGLKEFCQLAAIILAVDCLFLFGFFASVLTIMVEVRRIRIMRGSVRRVDSSADLAHILDDGTTPDPSAIVDEPADALTIRQKLVRLIFGTPSEDGKSEPHTQRLKLLLLSVFLVLHALNLCTTLTAKTAIRRHSATSATSDVSSSTSLLHTEFTRTDPSDSSISPILDTLSALHPSLETVLTVQVAPPTFFRLVLPNTLTTGELAGRMNVPRSTPGMTKVGSSMALLDRFMSGWTTLVGDPVLSKWIVIVLIVSVFLNGYLLKGIALGDQGTGEGYVPSSAPEAATRLLLGTSQAADSKDKKIKRRWSGGVEGLSRLQTEWTLADAAEMAKERRKILIREEKERDAAHLKAANDLTSKQKQQPAGSASTDSSDESAPGSPLFLTTTKKDRTPHAQGRLISANEGAADSLQFNGLPLPSILTPSGQHANGNGYVRDPPRTVSETSSDAAPDTPATTVADEPNSNAETPTVTKIALPADAPVRPLEEIHTIFAAGKGADLVTDEEVILLVQKGKLAAYALEKLLKDNMRAVKIRRALISRASSTKSLENSLLPYLHYDYSKVMGQCCENVVGYTPIPIGIAGPLRIDGEALPLPMATTEGALVASTSRGCKALNAGGGVVTVVTQDAMTRGPAVEFPTLLQCAAAKRWIDSEEGSTIMKASFNSTSRFARLQSLKTNMAGRTLFIRFATQTGDAMGMNMISKGTERALDTMMTDHFPDMKVVSLSGNTCTDKKSAAINWVMGRGKSVVAEAVVPGHVVASILKTSVEEVCHVNITKNLVGSALAGTLGGNNAHAANNLAAIFLATGQDPAQVVESASCITLMEPINEGRDLLISCSMPCIEVGTIGGGTILPPQKAMLELLGVAGPHPTSPGENARRLARIICAGVMAGELSLMSALAQGTLVKSHMALNRSAPATPAPATIAITGHSYLTPAPTRPSTPSLGIRQHSGLHQMTPMPAPPRH